MKANPNASILKHFQAITDPRVERSKKYPLDEIFFITICAVISGADNWVMIEEFGQAKQAWFEEQLTLENGIPSHDTLGNVFAAIDTEHFSHCFSQWVADLAHLSQGEVIAIDGKTLRRSVDHASNKAAIHMVSAWAQQNSLVLGQEKVGDKSNEITAIPKLLEKLDISGAVITIDAMGCQKKIAAQIINQEADYVLSLKGNHGDLHDDVKTYFSRSSESQNSAIDYDGGHGRVETRAIRVIDDIDWLKQRHPDWLGLSSIIAVTAKRELKDKVEQETRYFISSMKGDDPSRLSAIVRGHWSVENNLHWVLDVAFDEDHSRARQGNSAANLGVIRHIALNLLKNEKSSKVGIKTKRGKAGWDNRYLIKVLQMS